MSSFPKARLGAHYLIVFSLGFFALVAQALLFRDYLSAYEGAELGIAAFFGSWLLWVGAGALLAHVEVRVLSWVTDRFEVVPLLYIPAFIIQRALIQNSRALAGIQSHDLFPLGKMLPLSFVVNAPVCLVTGLSFALACRWFSREHRLSVARVYICEGLGSFTGGIVVTLMLGAGLPAESVFLWAALFVSGTVLLFQWAGRFRLVPLLAFLALAALLVGRADGRWAQSAEIASWQRLLPREGFLGSFATPQARYLYGRHRGQFNVIAWESVVESLPNRERAAEVVAIHLAQAPEARRFLVVGSGSFALCLALSDLPQTESVTWLSPDPKYPRRLIEALPEKLKAGAGRTEIPSIDARQFLQQTSHRYDLVLLNLPNATTLVLNRYFTREFLGLLKTRLRGNGVVGVRVDGGENVMGTELANLGASVFVTLKSVFSQIALKPGEETWLMASDAGTLSAAPAALRDRFKAIDGAEDLYPPEALMSHYLPDRIAFQLSSYAEAREADRGELLVNTDEHPKSLLHSLLFASRQAGAGPSLVRTVRSFAFCGLPILIAAVGLYGLLRLTFLATGERGRIGKAEAPAPAESFALTPFDSLFLVFSTGAVCMGLSVVLMFLYQSRFGSLFLHVGLISALVMLGLSIGGLAAEQLMLRWQPRARVILAGLIVAHLLVVLLVFLLPADLPHSLFVLLFLFCGLLDGVYVPTAAAGLKAAHFSDQASGSLVELNDHLGGALGSLLVGLVALPLLGTDASLIIIGILLAVNFVALLPYRAIVERVSRVPRVRPSRTAKGDSLVRPAAYCLFGLAAFLMVSAVLFSRSQGSEIGHLLRPAAEAMAGKSAVLTESSFSREDGEVVRYFVQENEDDSTASYVFSTDQLAPDTVGYGGPIVLAMKVDREGALLDWRVLKSRETPAYLEMLGDWGRSLVGRQVFRAHAMSEVDAVTGATVTSAAVLQGLERAGVAFASEALGLPVEEGMAIERSRWPDIRILTIILLAAAAIALHRRGRERYRIALLVTSLVITGFLLNVQYSVEHVFSLVSLQFPPIGLNATCLMVLGLPILVVIFGNIYCGYLCPFGALQELVGHLRPRSLRVGLDQGAWNSGRAVKYLVLFLLVCLFARSLSPGLSSADPLVTAFGVKRSAGVLGLAAILLGLSLLFPRFWCRSLCPAGAFLALLNGLRLTVGLVPPTNPARCPYGVGDRSELDCIYCDRCRGRGAEKAVERDLQPARWRRTTGLVFTISALLVALWLVGQATTAWRQGEAETGARSAAAQRGAQARDVDLQKLLDKIERGELSDHEALHYRRLEPSGD